MESQTGGGIMIAYIAVYDLETWAEARREPMPGGFTDAAAAAATLDPYLIRDCLQAGQVAIVELSGPVTGAVVDDCEITRL